MWGRKSRQLWSWELDEAGDEEASVSLSVPVSVMGKPETEMTDLVPALSAMPIDNNDTQEDNEPQSAGSMFSENIFTPTSTTMERTCSPSPILHPLATFPDDMEEMTEVQRGQLAIRRATIKVPDASLAFPISEFDERPVDLGGGSRKPSHRSSSAFAGSIRPSVSSLHSASASGFNRSLASPVPSPVNRRSDISPFEEIPVIVSSNQDTNPDADENDNDGPARTRVSIESVKAVTWPPLSTLLARFSRNGRSHVQHDKRPKMFGPEAPVEDPRVTALFESIVRDILVVGAISGVIWVALCLAVPCAGLV